MVLIFVIRCCKRRPRLRSKKWWWNIFSHLLNLSIVASFRFYQHVNCGSQISHKDFRREIARTLTRIETPRARGGGPISSVPKAVRYDNLDHFLQDCSQGRCYACKKNTSEVHQVREKASQRVQYPFPQEINTNCFKNFRVIASFDKTEPILC